MPATPSIHEFSPVLGAVRSLGAIDYTRSGWLLDTAGIVDLPLTGDQVSVNNGGTANASGSVQVDVLNVGLVTGATTASGTVNVTAGDLSGSSTLRVGTTANNITTADADGTLSVAGNVSGFTSYNVGISGFNSSGNATGDLTVDGTLQASLSGLSVGVSAGSADALGMAGIGAGISDVLFVTVGSSGSSANTASASGTGELTVLAGGIMGLDAGTMFTHGIVVENNVEIYRLMIGEGTPNQVSESETLTLLCLALAAFAFARRRRLA